MNPFKTGTAALIVSVALLAGCGGSESARTADIGALVACIDRSGSPGVPLETDTRDGIDLIAEGAGIGAIQVQSPHNELQIVAERNQGDAENIVAQYEAFSLGQVDRVGTVVLAYNKTPIPEESKPVIACLEEQGIV